MTRKDYVLIAAALDGVRAGYPSGNSYTQAVAAHRECVEAVAIALARDNPRFDRERFLDAAGVQL